MSTDLLNKGLQALQQQQYSEAVSLLGNFCQHYPDRNSDFYVQGLIALARAYRGNGQQEKAITLAQTLQKHSNREIQQWAKSFLSIVNQDEINSSGHSKEPEFNKIAGRAEQTGVRLMMPKVADNLAFASTFTITLLLGMVLSLCLGVFLISGGENPLLGLMISVAVTLVFNGVTFFLSPVIMDSTQKLLYQTRWVNLAEIKRRSPEAAEMILRVCRERQLVHPRLGIIDDQNPTAFTYGSLPGNARIVVSQGLFTYLDDDEIATVYAHELGHIVHWDFAIMTLASTLVQITYLIYLFARRWSHRGNSDNKLKDGLKVASIAAYFFYIIGTYLMLYLSRTREYSADHFAAEVTGNPNGLSRALVKIAYGITEELTNNSEPSQVLEGTRALGICDAKGAATTGTIYGSSAEVQRLGKVFVWDLFNPWAKLAEFNSTHPLTGKRIQALSTYAEQMGIGSQFNMASVIKEGNKLNKQKLLNNFFGELIISNSHIIGGILGFIFGLTLTIFLNNTGLLISSIAWGFGGGFILKTLLLYPDFKKAQFSDILTLMCDPYGSPVRGKAVQLKGTLIGRGDAGYSFGSDLKLQDQTGMIFTRYTSRFGAIGNFFFGANQVESLIGTPVGTVGWFRRGVAPWFDFMELYGKEKNVKSYPRFSGLITGFGIIILGIVFTLRVF
ncbi:M48 family metalloprotease [Crocosphaera watsonii WH 8501]|uniref:Peptidase M48, Ste24p:Peptidase M, neutral zinc metallopeptidases, zinc-binding site n=1 Tax=Crocosphaera watsonii WH 8501 TaxID=165597 RepID=Q4C1W8_CROWT|nr:zinc metalloprotease HtpX [Crocosphaera watsonii]EAM50148.1 Peptidase M48, Ste24p:Peptidase M, neutral zinc metallopeptidases, zinc-binding site [Crocosphaera watsonii WH 8501]